VSESREVERVKAETHNGQGSQTDDNKRRKRRREHLKKKQKRRRFEDRLQKHVKRTQT
jgi:hypothetical protein